MPQIPKPGRKRGSQVDAALRGLADSKQSLRTCAQCGMKVARSDCHKNRYHQYICRACLTKLWPSAQSSYRESGVPDARTSEASADKGLSRQKKRRDVPGVSPRWLRQSKLPVGRSDVPERMLHASVNVLIVLFLMVVIWLVWAQV